MGGYFFAMKRIFRGFVVGLFMLFCWPFFMYKKYGDIKYKLKDKTVIICNHYSTFDGFFIYLALRGKKINFVTIAETKKKLLSRFVTWLFDCYYIEENSVNLTFFKNCISALNSGGVICIFPEGAVNPRKFGFFDFQNSFAYFAKKTNSRILPVYLYPELSAFKRSKIYIGQEISAEDCARKSIFDIAIIAMSRVMEYSLTFQTE